MEGNVHVALFYFKQNCRFFKMFYAFYRVRFDEIIDKVTIGMIRQVSTRMGKLKMLYSLRLSSISTPISTQFFFFSFLFGSFVNIDAERRGWRVRVLIRLSVCKVMVIASVGTLKIPSSFHGSFLCLCAYPRLDIVSY